MAFSIRYVRGMIWARQKDTESHKRKCAAAQPRPALGRRPWFALLRRARSLRRFALAIRRESVARSRRFITLASDPGWVMADVLVAQTHRERRQGVRLGHDRVLIRTSSVHGCGLVQPLGLIGLDASGRVSAVERLDPGTFIRIPGAAWILELPIDKPAPNLGSQLAIYPRGCDRQTDTMWDSDRQPR